MQFALALVGILCLLSCKKHSSASRPMSEIVASRYLKVKEPGVGYSTLLSNFTSGTCVDAQKNYRAIYPHNIASFEGGHSEDRGLSTDTIAWGGSAEANYGIFSVTGDIEVEASLVEEDLKTSVYTSFSLDAGTLFLNRYELTPFGQGLLSKPLEERYLACGDEFINQINLGARVFVGLEYSFATKEVKTAFSAALKGSASLPGKNIEKIFWEEQISAVPFDDVNGTVNVIFEQEGGDYEAFLAYKQKLVPKNCYVGTVKKKQTAADLGEGSSPCIRAYRQIINEYVRTQFPQQLKGLALAQSDSISASALVPLKYYTMPYRSIGYPQFSPPELTLPAEIKNLRDIDIKELSDLFLKLTARLRVFRNIFDNTSNNIVLDDLMADARKLLLTVKIDSAERFEAEQRFLKADYDRVSNLCGTTIGNIIKDGIKSKNFGEVKIKIAECKDAIADVKNKINNLLKL